MVRSLRRGALVLHRWGGLVVGTLILALALTGAVLAAEGPLTRLAHPELYHVRRGLAPLPLAARMSAAARAHPELQVTGIRLPRRDDLADEIMTGGRTVILTDPYTGTVLGAYDPGVGLLRKVRQLHTHLMAGETGEQVAGVSSLCAALLVLSGLLLWWPKRGLGLRTDGGWRRFIHDLHTLLGAGAAVFLLAITLTGVLLSQEQLTNRVATRFGGPVPPPPPTRSVAPATDASVDADQALAAALAALPGTEATMVSLPATPDGVYTVALRFPEDRTPGGRTRAFVDRWNGAVLATTSPRGRGLTVRAAAQVRSLHTGDIFGLPSQILAGLSALVLGWQVLSGAAMWWSRPTRAAVGSSPIFADRHRRAAGTTE
jgi:uncharacterized iron-regulated membrane protein